LGSLDHTNGQATPSNGVYNDNFGVYDESTHYERDGSSKKRPDKEGTRGRWKIRGTVYYVPAADFVANDWTIGQHQQGGVRYAGSLLSRWDPPVAGNGLRNGATLGRPLCTRQFAGTWDWTNKNRRPVSAPRAWPWGGNFDSVDSAGWP
jgi:hypothetical protein